MYTVRIHTDSDDSPRPLVVDAPIATGAVYSELRGVAHFFRRLPHSPAGETSPNTSTSSYVFLPAVPNYLSPVDFISFCHPQFINYFLHVCFISDDSIDNRYCISIEMTDKDVAEEFVMCHFGKRFNDQKLELCYVFHVQSVECYSVRVASNPPGFTELPTCPVCLGRFNKDVSGIHDSFCYSTWINYSCRVCCLCERLVEKPICGVCGSSNASYMCMLCGLLGCNRYERLYHWNATSHAFYLEIESNAIVQYDSYKYVMRGSISDDMSLDGVSVGCKSKEDLGTELANMQRCNEELKSNCSEFAEVLKSLNNMVMVAQRDLETIQKKNEDNEKKFQDLKKAYQ